MPSWSAKIKGTLKKALQFKAGRLSLQNTCWHCSSSKKNCLLAQKDKTAFEFCNDTAILMTSVWCQGFHGTLSVLNSFWAKRQITQVEIESPSFRTNTMQSFLTGSNYLAPCRCYQNLRDHRQSVQESQFGVETYLSFPHYRRSYHVSTRSKTDEPAVQPMQSANLGKINKSPKGPFNSRL